MRRTTAKPLTRSGRPRAPARSAAAEAKLALLDELVPQLARAIAPNCEVALHDAGTSPPTIRAIGNGHVTGRQVGDRMTRVAIDGREVETIDEPLFNYHSRTPRGQEVRNSLLPVRHEGKVIGYLAVNFMIQDLELARQVLSFLVGAEPQRAIIEDPAGGARSAALLLDEYLEGLGLTAALLGRAERLDLLRHLQQRGAFALRGAVEDVARKLGVSRTTIYNDLGDIGAGAAVAGAL